MRITYATYMKRRGVQKPEETPRQRRIMQRLIRAGGDRDPPVSLWQITLEVERMLDETIETALKVKKIMRKKGFG